MSSDKFTDVQEEIEEAREQFFSDAREEFFSSEESGERWKEFVISDEVQDLWREAEEEAWKDEQERLEDEWRDKLAEMTGG